MARLLLGAAIVVAMVISPSLCLSDKMKEVLSWKIMDFQYPTPEARDAAIKSGEFIPENSNPLGMEIWKDKVFVTVPRWKAGVPSSLNYVKFTEGETAQSPALIPYPDLDTNTLPNKSDEKTPEGGDLPHKIVSVYRVRVDACDRLWVMDTGMSDLLGPGFHVYGPNKLLVYDLKTDKLLRQFAFKPDVLKEDSFFANVIVDVTADKCDDAFAYVPDLGGYGIVVYSWKDNKAWRVKHNYFYMDPLAGDYNVAGINFQWTDGVFAIALSPPKKDDKYRTVYFHALSSTREFKVSSRILQNETICNLAETYSEFKELGSRGPNTQSSASYMDDSTGILFYTQVNRDGLGCWNSITKADEYNPDTNALPVSDKVKLIFPNDLKVDSESNVWLLSNRMPVFRYKKLDHSDVNFRILKGKALDIAKGTVCDPDHKS